jgi:uncharacterized protein (DUF58 family)
VLAVLLSPLQALASLRGSMTAASVSLLLIGIISMNIVWGYPWVGMFSACLSLMLGGWTINRVMRPRLQIDYSLPRLAAAGQPFALLMHIVNRSRLPALDLEFCYEPARLARRRRTNWTGRRRTEESRPAAGQAEFQSLGMPRMVGLFHPLERTDLNGSLVFLRRGIHALPDLVVTSLFPFHLFRSTRRYPSLASIAITPRVLTGEEDHVARGLLNTLGGWSHKLLCGDSLDYTGSREYEIGMPVRRWDFASWARLGRPIVREFQSPSIRTVTLIVDTASDPGRVELDADGQPLVERVLSVAATAITDLTRKMVRVDLLVTSQSPATHAAPGRWRPVNDSESLLIQLAAAETVTPRVADERIGIGVEQAGRSPVLILTSRCSVRLPPSATADTTVLRVEPAHALPPPSSSPRRSRGRRSAAARGVTDAASATQTVGRDS